MKSSIHTFRLLILIAAIFVSPVLRAATLSGTYTLPGTVNGTTVNNLTDLSTLLNAGANTVTGTVIFEFTADYNSNNTETLPITFTSFPGTGNVIIRPAVSVSSPLITGGSPGSAALIQFNGVKNLSFEGRPGGTGHTGEWTMQNTAAGGSYPTILFINGASYNGLDYITVLGSGSSSTSIINFSTSTVLGGNSYNFINNCNIGNYAGFPYNPILSSGTAGSYANSNNSIYNNNIYNFATYNNNSPYYAAINIGPTGNGSSWSISYNSIYSNANYLNFGSTPYHAIYLNAGPTSIANNITHNYIGGQQPLCAGSPWQVPAYGANGYGDFDGIVVNAGACAVTNNVIKNIFMASKYGSSTFRGISIVSGVAIVSGNTIGADNDSIVSGLYGTMIGIQNQSTSAVTISNNTIANFISDSRSYVNGTSSTTTGVTIGIYAYSSSAVVGATTIINNSIYNFSRNDNYNNNLYFPVNAGGGSQVTGQNIIYQMNILAGIYVQTVGSGLQTISKNTISNLSTKLTGGTNKIYINGIVDYAGTGGSNVNGNLVYGLYAPNTFGAANYFYGVNGIYIPASSSATNTITNNMVALGYRPTDGSSIENAIISGIWDNTTGANSAVKVKLYHNSVYIGGSNTNQFSNTLNSYAFRRVLDYGSTAYDSLALYNNIFVNNRSNTAGTAINYGIYLNGTLDAASDYNDIYGTGTGFIFGDAGGTDYATLAAYRTGAAGFEANSISADPLFVSPATATPNLHVPSTTPIDQAGTANATLVYDFDSLVRASYTPVDIGAAVNCSGGAANVSLTVSQDTVCTGTTVTFTASSTNGGSSPTYNFYINGSSAQNGSSSTYTVNSPTNNDSVYVIITSNAACVSPATASSNTIKVTVTNATVVPTAGISISQNNICSGTSVTFTASGTNLGTAPTYNFYKNNTSVQNSSSNIYTSTSLQNSDSVWVIITSNASCLSTTTATSSKIIMVVTPTVTPTAGITATQTAFCAGTSVSFTASSTNGGTSPTYTFYRNNNSVQTGTSTQYNISNLNNNDSVWVVVTSNATCASPITAASIKIHVTVTPTVTPTINITTASTTVCNNSPVTFNSSITNGGTSPSYQWKLNGNNITTGTLYNTSTLANGDVVTCVLTSNANCATPDTSLSNSLTITVTNSVTPTISISASPSLSVCSGNTVNFNAVITGGGNSPTYTWKKNGTTAGSNSASYSNSAPANGDIITCILTSSSACASPTTITSNADTIKVYQPATTPQSQHICQGDSIIFYGTVLKQSNTYTHILTTVHGCDSTISLTLTVNPVVTTQRNAAVCFGQPYLFNGNLLTQSGVYRDTVPSSTGCDSVIALTLTVSSSLVTNQSQSICSGSAYNFNGRPLTASGTYIDSLIAAGGCDSIVTLVLNVVPKPVPVVSLQGTNTLSTTPFASYQWLLNNQPIAGANTSVYVALQNGAYSVAVIDTNICNDTSAVTNITTLAVNDLQKNLSIQLFPNPTSGNLNIAVSGFSGSQLHIRLYNTYGSLIYFTEKEIINGAGINQIDMNKFASGIYILQLLSDDINISRRVEVIK